jgi:hypothetical protein
VRNRWFRSGAIKLHILAIFIVAVCLTAGWWQLQRATGGNGNSWAYVVEWPFFAGYAGWMWWKLLHEEPGFAKEEPAATEPPAAEGPPAPEAPPAADNAETPSPEHDTTRT